MRDSIGGLHKVVCRTIRRHAIATTIFCDLAALINHYRGDAAPHVVQAMLALALPVGPDEMRMTNRNWAFTAQGLRADAGLTQLRLVNDFVAAAAGIGALSASESIQIGGVRSSSRHRCRAGPGYGTRYCDDPE